MLAVRGSARSAGARRLVRTARPRDLRPRRRQRDPGGHAARAADGARPPAAPAQAELGYFAGAHGSRGWPRNWMRRSRSSSGRGKTRLELGTLIDELELSKPVEVDHVSLLAEASRPPPAIRRLHEIPRPGTARPAPPAAAGAGVRRRTARRSRRGRLRRRLHSSSQSTSGELLAGIAKVVPADGSHAAARPGQRRHRRPAHHAERRREPVPPDRADVPSAVVHVRGRRRRHRTAACC